MSERRRLQLKPRDPEAAARADLERAASAKSNPFGSAKPRESVLATRSGKSEQEILAEEAKKGLKLRLNQEQRQQKEAAEAAVADLEEQAALEVDPEIKAGLEKQIAAGKASLDDLMEAFAKSTLEAAAKGEVQRPSERRAAQGLGQQQPDDFVNFQQGGGRAYAGNSGPGNGYQGGGGGSDGYGGGSFGGGGGGGRQYNQVGGSQYQDRNNAQSGGAGAANGGYSQGGAGSYEPAGGPAPYQNQDRF